MIIIIIMWTRGWTTIHLVPRLRVPEIIPPLPHASNKRGRVVITLVFSRWLIRISAGIFAVLFDFLGYFPQSHQTNSRIVMRLDLYRFFPFHQSSVILAFHAA
jgi:hypothetical protein